ncbi:unnamed protein product [Echinostoma caproni]|uniref:Integrase p58-like C-terminal domain-containing protein n=1 Tax=Echinostoma caproni TaxID=27848 RepID=A0A183A1L4_9TREM|nr:unnamed protein product [Echinostoma caproni]
MDGVRSPAALESFEDAPANNITEAIDRATRKENCSSRKPPAVLSEPRRPEHGQREYPQNLGKRFGGWSPNSRRRDRDRNRNEGPPRGHYAIPGMPTKFKHEWTGPFVVVEILSPSTCRVTKAGTDPERESSIVHFNSLKPVAPVVSGTPHTPGDLPVAQEVEVMTEVLGTALPEEGAV